MQKTFSELNDELCQMLSGGVLTTDFNERVSPYLERLQRYEGNPLLAKIVTELNAMRSLDLIQCIPTLVSLQRGLQGIILSLSASQLDTPSVELAIPILPLNKVQTPASYYLLERAYRAVNNDYGFRSKFPSNPQEEPESFDIRLLLYANDILELSAKNIRAIIADLKETFFPAFDTLTTALFAQQLEAEKWNNYRLEWMLQQQPDRAQQFIAEMLKRPQKIKDSTLLANIVGWMPDPQQYRGLLEKWAGHRTKVLSTAAKKQLLRLSPDYTVEGVFTLICTGSNEYNDDVLVDALRQLCLHNLAVESRLYTKIVAFTQTLTLEEPTPFQEDLYRLSPLGRLSLLLPFVEGRHCPDLYPFYRRFLRTRFKEADANAATDARSHNFDYTLTLQIIRILLKEPNPYVSKELLHYFAEHTEYFDPRNELYLSDFVSVVWNEAPICWNEVQKSPEPLTMHELYDCFGSLMQSYPKIFIHSFYQWESFYTATARSSTSSHPSDYDPRWLSVYENYIQYCFSTTLDPNVVVARSFMLVYVEVMLFSERDGFVETLTDILKLTLSICRDDGYVYRKPDWDWFLSLFHLCRNHRLTEQQKILFGKLSSFFKDLT